jgi:PKD repeat protein
MQAGMRHLLAVAATLVAILAVPTVAAASLQVTPSTVTVADGTTVTFNATADASSTLTWAFDDNTSAQGTTVSHTFTGVGQHLVTVTESGASSGTATITVTVTAAQTTVSVPVAVPRKLRALVKHLGRVGAIAVVTVRDDAGNTGDETVKLTLTR